MYNQGGGGRKVYFKEQNKMTPRKQVGFSKVRFMPFLFFKINDKYPFYAI